MLLFWILIDRTPRIHELFGPKPPNLSTSITRWVVLKVSSNSHHVQLMWSRQAANLVKHGSAETAVCQDATCLQMPMAQGQALDVVSPEKPVDHKRDWTEFGKGWKRTIRNCSKHHQTTWRWCSRRQRIWMNLHERFLDHDCIRTWSLPERARKDAVDLNRRARQKTAQRKKRQLAKFDFERQMIQAIQKMEIQVIVKSVPLLWFQAVAPGTIESHWIVGHVNQVEIG